MGKPSGTVQLPRIARPKTLVALCAAVALVGVCGFLAGVAVPSVAPAGDGDNSPPTIDVAVERRSVTPPRTVQGTVDAGDAYKVPFSGLDSSAVLPYVTEVARKPGESLGNGQLLLAVAGRPTIALRITSPLYRNLHVGDTGRDVASFETALQAAGGEGFDVDNIFTVNTLAAAKLLWASYGYELPKDPAGTTDPNLSNANPSSPIPSPTLISSTSPPSEKPAYIDVVELIQLTSDQVTVLTVLHEGALAEADTPMATLQTSPRRVIARITVLDEAAYAPGTAVTLQVNGQSDQPATVSRLGDFVPSDGAAQTVSGRDAYIDLPAEWTSLAEGTTVTIRTVDTDSPVLVVPLSAVRKASTDPHVVVSHSDNFAPGKTVPIEIVASGDGWVQISEHIGLSEGDTIVLEP